MKRHELSSHRICPHALVPSPMSKLSPARLPYAPVKVHDWPGTPVRSTLAARRLVLVVAKATAEFVSPPLASMTVFVTVIAVPDAAEISRYPCDIAVIIGEFE